MSISLDPVSPNHMFPLQDNLLGWIATANSFLGKGGKWMKQCIPFCYFHLWKAVSNEMSPNSAAVHQNMCPRSEWV